MAWLDDFREETSLVIQEPLLRCLAEAVAIVESDHGCRRLVNAQGINEIGYKAIPGHPSARVGTAEADAQGRLVPMRTAFRIFRDRAEQARALLWLWRGSSYYEAARLLWILAFYSAYAPGRTEGARALVAVFNELAAGGLHPGVRPISLIGPERMDPDDAALNHAAARAAVRLFAELTHAT